MSYLLLRQPENQTERRRLVAKWRVQQGFTGWENVGEPLTRHRLQLSQRFQAALIARGTR